LEFGFGIKNALFVSENRGNPDSFRAPCGYGVDRGDAANRLERGAATGHFGEGAREERYWSVDQLQRHLGS
jgi:hypothetical protein